MSVDVLKGGTWYAVKVCSLQYNSMHVCTDISVLFYYKGVCDVTLHRSVDDDYSYFIGEVSVASLLHVVLKQWK